LEWYFSKNYSGSGDRAWVDQVQFVPIPACPVTLSPGSLETDAARVQPTARYVGSMRQPEEHSQGGGRRIKPPSTKTVRFASVVAAAGKPEVYLPLFDPKKDRTFMRAVREHRVLSIRQDPASKRQDYGTVGFDEHGHFTYLVFPKSLAAFRDARVVGIKYEVVSGSSVRSGAAPRSAKTRRLGKERAATAPRRARSPQPPKPVEPQPKEFRVRLRVTTVTEKDVTVKAMTKREAREKAERELEGEGDVKVVSVSAV